MAKASRRGGSFAPPLSDEKLAAYKALAMSEGGPVGEAMTSLLACCETWWGLPESGLDGSRLHPSGAGVIVPLDSPIAAALEPLIPWKHEIAAIQGLFDSIPAQQKELRDAAFHLLWHVIELDNDREPITSDKILAPNL